MTVKELREYLSGIDDDTEVFMSTQMNECCGITVIYNDLPLKRLELRAWSGSCADCYALTHITKGESE